MDHFVVWVLFAMLGGFLSGCISLGVGGVGVLLTVRRQLRSVALEVADLDTRVEREIKRRAADSRPPKPDLRELGPLAPVAEMMSREEIVRRHG